MEGLVDTNFWDGRKVFITGHNGFKGSWLSLFLYLLGANVTGLALTPETKESHPGSIFMSSNIVSILEDIGDLKIVKEALATAEAEIVFHLAGQAFVREGYRDPSTTFRTNVVGTVHLLEAVRHTPNVKVVVIVTSDKVYAPRNEKDGKLYAFREHDRLGGHDPYSISKVAAELVVEGYKNSMLNPVEIAIATARSGNVLGGGDWGEDRIVPDMVRALMGPKELAIRNPSASRAWLHVLDVLNGYLILAEYLTRDRGKYAGSWNFAPSDQNNVSVGTLVERFTNYWGTKVKTVVNPDPKAPEVKFLAIDATKSQNELGWKTLLNFDEMLIWTVDWYRAFAADPSTARNITEEQILKFMSLKVDSEK